ncbi:MAG: hypothetical protein A2Z14_05695 [Chloroflexi bacterium RBG_16_48_8]|nr:MAG: hypothetical protein A2Z14_05695 [Chloroflexi bacterium RBG_16_48_8]
MFSELPKLFERNFALGYFIPVAAFIAANAILLFGYGISDDILSTGSAELLIGTTIIGLVSWLGGIILLALNRELIRIFEGYGKLNPLRLFSKQKEKRFDELVQKKNHIDEQCKKYREENKKIPSEIINKYASVMRDLSEKFPDQKEWLIPTTFGNIIRAFEVYPRVMYGIEAVQGWNRLLAVMPDNYLKLIDNAKAQMDFWINLKLLSIIYLFEYLIFVIHKSQLKALETTIIALIVLLLSNSRACSAALGWGEYVKSAFDVYLPELRTKLGYSELTNKEDERRFWGEFSWAMIYRRPMEHKYTASPDNELDISIAE